MYKVPSLDHFEWQKSVAALQSSPPGSPVRGDRYIVGSSPSGSWSGQEDNIAEYDGSGWEFISPSQGWTVFDKDQDTFLTYSGSWKLPNEFVDAPVDSVFGRTGSVTAQSGDYSFSQISGSVANAQVPSSAVTQHQGSIDHNELSNYAVNQHRVWENSIAQNVHLDNIPSIPNSKLANSTISGVALGDTLAELSAGSGITMTSYDGSAARTIAVTNPFVPGDYVPASGGEFTGNITIPNATADTHAVNRQTGDGRWANLSGDTFTGNVGIGVSPSESLHIDGTLLLGQEGFGGGEQIRLSRSASFATRFHSILTQHSATPTSSSISFLVHDGDTTTSQLEVLRLRGDGQVGFEGLLRINRKNDDSETIIDGRSDAAMNDGNSGREDLILLGRDTVAQDRQTGFGYKAEDTFGRDPVFYSDKPIRTDSSYKIGTTIVIDSSRNIFANEIYADYAELEDIDAGTATFSGNITIPNATSPLHALNRLTADGRYLMLTGNQSVSGIKTFSDIRSNTLRLQSAYTSVGVVNNFDFHDIEPFTGVAARIQGYATGDRSAELRFFTGMGGTETGTEALRILDDQKVRFMKFLQIGSRSFDSIATADFSIVSGELRTEGLTTTRQFYDFDQNEHFVNIVRGRITSWSVN